jgi:PKD repeat protein
VSDRLRRHVRLIAGSLALVLLAGVGYVLQSAGSARARPARAVRSVHATAPVLAPASQRRVAAIAGGPTAPASRPAAARRGAAAAKVALSSRPGRTRTGLPTAAPSARTLADSLKQITGLSPSQVSSRPVCPRAITGHVTCGAQALVLRSNGSLVRPRVSRYSALGRIRPATAHARAAVEPSGAATPDPGTPGYLQQAYDLAYLSQSGGSSDTVAIVDAFDDPTAETDLAVYRSRYGLGDCTTANGCFEKTGQDGGSPPSEANPAWEQEISLDLDAVSAICPGCHILLIEANSDAFSDLEAAMSQAGKTPGVKQIVASWWGQESDVPAGFTTLLNTLSGKGIATVAATGDQGYPGPGENNYPAALPGVTAAGGTSLAPAAAAGARGFGESAWSWNGLTGGGSGCDRHFQRPAYQPAAGCVGRAYADLSADSDPDTGLEVYNSQSGSPTGWSVIGGTSLAAPLIAAYYAITGLDGATPRWAYGKAGLLNDILSGSTGGCAASIAYICNAGPGYDGPTGVGSISGSVVTGAPGIDGPAVRVGQGQSNTYTQSVAPHGATIAGGIYRNGLDTHWWIEYGPDDTYGSHTAPVDIGAGSAPVSVTGYLSQLTPGTPYHYRLVAQNSLGTTYGYDYTFTTAAAPGGAPTAAFSVTSGSPAPGDDVSFDATASSPQPSITGYTWNFGDGSTPGPPDTTPQADHHYAARGTYTVTLTVTTDGQTDSTSQTITVDDPPTAAFTASPSAVPEGNQVTFDASGSSPGDSAGSITDYSWDFGDGTSAVDRGTDATVSHTFTDPGTYTVTLTTTDDLHVVNTTPTTEQVTVAPFTVSAPVPAPGGGDDVTFTAGSPGAACGTVTGYTWDFGDGSSETGPDRTVVHNYTDPGSKTVSVTFQCSGGNQGPDNATVVVDTPPTAAFTPPPPPTAVRPGTAITFDASGSHAAGGRTITDYAWDFGDGAAVVHAGSANSITHTFTTPGLYTVTLSTTDDLGVSGQPVSQNVTVDQPSAAFTTSPSTTTQGSPVTFDASATDDPESTITDYAWDFGDHSGSVHTTTPVTTHPFSAVGTYTVKLTVTDAFGFTDVMSRQVVVTPAVTVSSNPPTPTPVITTPTPTPPPSGTTTPPRLALVARLSGGGRQRLTQVLSHGIRLGLVVNQRVRASWQVTLPLSQTKQTRHSVRGTSDNAQLIVVLLRRTQTFGAGTHTITLRLSPAAVRRLATRGPLVLTIRVTLTTADGRSLTRTATLRLARP